ncbi:MAG: phosphoribosylamine--glycine ligase [Bacillota bacterium]|nr:phosphoribosylamine--glycine ligase [Bacillota bacterium]
MKVLVVGGGGREHALAWKLAKSPLLGKLFIAPGNPGTAELGTNVPIEATNTRDLVDFALSNDVDVTVVGPEQPLELGIVDVFKDRGLQCFGPTKDAARVETSKVWCKELMSRLGVPSAAFKVFSDPSEAAAYVRKSDVPLVIKADGLAAGKGVVVARTGKEAAKAVDDIMVARTLGQAGTKVVVEEFLEGEEVSVLAICWGKSYCLLPSSQDHKQVFDGDEGPNTGGMGAYAPVPRFDTALEDQVRDRVIEPLLWGLERQGTPYSGVLYCGLMLTSAGPKVLEINARFGDPEAQVILPLLDVDLLELAIAAIKGDPAGFPASPRGSAACVVLASGGYPGSYKKGLTIEGLDDARSIAGVEVFHAGTAVKEKRLVTNGGRVVGVTAWAPDLKAAVDTAYKAVSRVNFEGMHYRKDIAHKALSMKR